MGFKLIIYHNFVHIVKFWSYFYSHNMKSSNYGGKFLPGTPKNGSNYGKFELWGFELWELIY